MSSPPLPDLPIEIDVAIPHEPWRAALPNLEHLSALAVEQALATLSDPKLGELSLAFVSDAQIQALHHNYREKDKPTNVLSFPAAGPVSGPAAMLGDVVIALETVETEAKQKLISVQDHTAHLIIHGFLHLQGYDHETDQDAAQMEGLEIQALAALDIDNPYEIHD